MLSPRWGQIRIGPLLRGGIDLRSYHSQILLLRLFRKRVGDIGGLRRIWLPLMADRYPEPAKLDCLDLDREACSKDAGIVVFEGAKDCFRGLNGWDRFLHRELRAITRDRWLHIVDEVDQVPIAVNVRRAKDFPDPKAGTDFNADGPVRTPLSWYVESLQVIRKTIGYPAAAFVVSDGAEEDLGDILGLENVSFVRPGCAISDLLLLAKAKVLVASGGSSFSAWASFLGQMPTISYPGQPLTWFRLRNRTGNYLGTFDPSAPEQSFLDQVRLVLQR